MRTFDLAPLYRATVGFDQLAVIRAAEGADARIDFWNADGTMAGACGNATRCVAHYEMDRLGSDCLVLRTERGMLEARGHYLLFADADGATPFREVLQLLEAADA